MSEGQRRIVKVRKGGAAHMDKKMYDEDGNELEFEGEVEDENDGYIDEEEVVQKDDEEDDWEDEEEDEEEDKGGRP
jgi:hypothetical protein